MRPTTALIISTLILLFTSCDEQEKLQFEEYDYEIKGFTWEPMPYKFSSFIQDSVLAQKGNYTASWDYSYIGDIKNTLEKWDIESEPKDTLSTEKIKAFEKFERQPAHDLIIDQAKDKRVTIINEAHHMPQHRVFTTSLLQELYNEGYRHLGMESFFSSKKSDSILLKQKYPVLTNGFYVKEPQYGNIIREAVKIGFKIFGYESQGHKSPKEREINQAKNIVQYIVSNPHGKYLIHCGFSHGTEGKIGGSWEKAMAGRLTEYTDLDPLTINQTSYSEKSKKELENQYYQLTDVEEPSVYILKDSVFGQYRKGSWFDISIFHPRTKNINRPAWLIIDDRRQKKINFSDADIECPCLVFAYKDGEEIGTAVPYDIQETSIKEVDLILDNDTYNIVIWNQKRKALITNITN